MNLDFLKQLNGVFMGDDIGTDFCHDELPGVTAVPDAVVEAASAEDVANLLKACCEAGVPVTVRGAGTGKVGGSIAINGGVVLSVKNMNHVIAVDAEAKTMTVQPGVLLQDIKAEAEKVGLYYPVDPGEKTATIGGNVATNAAGPSAVKYGKTADYVADAVVVLADGSVAKLSDKAENWAVIGSEGTLGVITEVTLKLVEKPGKDSILLLPFADTETCINAALKILESSLAPAVLEYLDGAMVAFSAEVAGGTVFPVDMEGEPVGATLMVTIEGDDEDALDEQMELVAELAEELECLDILVVDTPTLKREAWASHDAFHTSTETAKSEEEMNIDVPAASYAEMVEFAKQIGEAQGLKILCYGHVGSGGLHIHALSDLARADAATAFETVAAAVYAKCEELGGDISGEYGIGYGKKAYLSEESKAEFAAKKSVFDTKGILNPGKII